jgi:hypothetical protein
VNGGSTGVDPAAAMQAPIVIHVTQIPNDLILEIIRFSKIPNERTP